MELDGLTEQERQEKERIEPKPKARFVRDTARETGLEQQQQRDRAWMEKLRERGINPKNL